MAMYPIPWGNIFLRFSPIGYLPLEVCTGTGQPTSRGPTRPAGMFGLHGYTYEGPGPGMGLAFKSTFVWGVGGGTRVGETHMLKACLCVCICSCMVQCVYRECSFRSLAAWH